MLLFFLLLWCSRRQVFANSFIFFLHESLQRLARVVTPEPNGRKLVVAGRGCKRRWSEQVSWYIALYRTCGAGRFGLFWRQVEPPPPPQSLGRSWPTSSGNGTRQRLDNARCGAFNFRVASVPHFTRASQGCRFAVEMSPGLLQMQPLHGSNVHPCKSKGPLHLTSRNYCSYFDRV